MTFDEKNLPSNRRVADRIPFETNVHVEFEKFSGFISEYSTNISEGGMFIKSTNPAPVGTILSFEFKLKDNFTLIQGLGEVAWIRYKSVSTNEPPGMGVKFREISMQSKQLISTMITNHVSKGGKVFSINEPVDKTRTLAFFDTGETAVDIPSHESTQVDDKSNLEALFDVPLKEEPSVPAHPSDSTKKDLEALFSLDNEPDPIISVPPNKKSKNHDPELKEHTRPDMPLLLKEEKKARKGIWIVLAGLFISILGGGYFYRKDILPFFKNTPLSFISDFIEPPSSGKATTFANAPTKEPPKPKQPPADKAPPLHETASAPLDSVIDGQMDSTAKTTPTSLPTVAATNSAVPVTGTTSQTPVATPTTAPVTPTAVAKIAPSTPIPTAVSAEQDVDPAKKTFTANRVLKVSYEKVQTGLILSIETNGAVKPDQYSYMSLTEGSPREVIKVVVNEKLHQSKVAIAHPSIAQIRVGNHAGSTGNEVHLVVDLKNPNFRIARAEVHKNLVQFYFEEKK